MRVWASIILGVIGAGCSIHPQTQDFSRDYVPDIVKKIKCEARDAILQTVGPDEKNYLMETGVAFAFDFIMSEANSAGTAGTLGIPVPNGSVSVTLDLSEDKERQTKQRVVVSDTFGDLVKMTDCGEAQLAENFRYPVTGNIGLLATFENYYRLMKSHAGNSLVGTFEDEVEYKTDLTSSLSSKLKLVAVSTRAIEASGGFGADRSDLHRVKLTFTPVPNAAQSKAIAKAKKRARDKELALLRQERAIPLAVELKKSGDGTTIQGFREGGGEQQVEIPPPPVKIRKPSNLEIKEEALRTLEKSDSRAFQDSFRREFESR